MAKISDVIAVMEQWAPSLIAESWDNPGLAVGEPRHQADRVILTLDVTDQTLKTAREMKADLIISHHPSLFKPLSTLSGNSLPSRIIRQAIKYDIALFSAHTNLDQAPHGVSMSLAETLGLTDIVFLAPGNCELLKFVTFVPSGHTNRVRQAAANAGAGVIGDYTQCSFSVAGTGTFIPGNESSPYTGEKGFLSETAEDRLEMIVPKHCSNSVICAVREAHPYEEMAYDLYPLSMKDVSFGYGAAGNLNPPLEPETFIGMVKESLMVESLLVSKGTGRNIKRVAVMGGSGSDFIKKSIDAGADAFITGEMGHHDYIEHGESIMLVDASHRGTELPVLEAAKRRLNSNEMTGNIEIIIDKGSLPFTYAGNNKQLNE